MALKAILDSLDGVPEALHEHYKKDADGKYRLDADGVEDVSGLKSALEKERNERKTTSQKLKELTEQLGDIDPVKAREALAKLQEMEDKKMIDSGKIDELLSQRTERMKKDFETQTGAFNKTIETLKQEVGARDARLSELLIDTGLRDAAAKAGIKASAIPDVILRGKQLYKIKDGRPVPLKGEDIIYGKNPNEPMTMDEWLTGMASDAPHWFEESTGGGAKKTTSTGTTKKKRSEMTIKEKSAFISEHGQEAFFKLPA